MKDLEINKEKLIKELKELENNKEKVIKDLEKFLISHNLKTAILITDKGFLLHGIDYDEELVSELIFTANIILNRLVNQNRLTIKQVGAMLDTYKEYILNYVKGNHH
jgi:hypothetical protein